MERFTTVPGRPSVGDIRTMRGTQAHSQKEMTPTAKFSARRFREALLRALSYLFMSCKIARMKLNSKAG
jgi:hypothetical protein